MLSCTSHSEDKQRTKLSFRERNDHLQELKIIGFLVKKERNLVKKERKLERRREREQEKVRERESKRERGRKARRKEEEKNLEHFN